MSYHLYRLGRFAARRPWAVIGAWFAMAVLVIGASITFGQTLEDKFEIPGVDSERATNLLREAQSDRAGLTAQVVLTPYDEGATFFDSAEARAALARVQAEAANLPKVLGVSDTAGELASGPDIATASGFVSPDGRVAIIRLQYPGVEQLDQQDLDNLWDFAEEARTGSPLQVEAGGDIVFSVEEPASSVAELIGLVAAAIILFLAFRSLIAMGLPILIALFGLAVGISLMPLISHLVEIPGFAPQMATMIGIGVGIDYALFIVTRYREHLARGMTAVESAGRAVATAGQAVIFAGGTVVIAILGLAVAGLPALTAAGIATAIIVLLMVLAAISLLPALLGLAGHWINRIGLKERSPAMGNRARSGWERWGEHVSRHAWPYAVGVTILLLALTAPVLALQIGFPDDGTKPTSRSERRAYDLVAQGFGPGINGPLVIAIDISEDATVIEPLFEATLADEGIASVAAPEINAAAGVATFFAFPTTSPQDSDTFETIKRLRSEVFPPIVAESAARAYIGGSTATWADLGDRASSRLPWFIAAVVSLSFVLLMLLFRSILVPLKAAILNLLSIGAAYGVLVMVFQWGWGAELIGLETTLPILSFIPMFMFAVLFGLSMDYEVFLLSRVREEYLLTGDNQGSVIYGIAKTGRVITSAALIMIAVFLGFVLGDDPVVKMMGLGLATAIFVDATIVRMILVPATMKLMGNANWWIPAWLDRLLPTIDIEGETRLPEPEMEAGRIETELREPAVA